MHKMNSLTKCLISSFIAIVVLITGCSDGSLKALTIDGQILLDGTPLEDAAVGFTAISEGIPVANRYKQAMTDENGSFEMKGVLQGEYMVTVTQGAPPLETADLPAAVPGESRLEAYATNSPLRAKVAPDTTTFTFELTGPSPTE